MPPATVDIAAQLICSITPVESTDAVAVVWQELEARGAPHFFFTWTWIGNWLRIVLERTPVYLFEARCEDRIVSLALLTTCESRRLKGRLKIRQLQVNEFRADGYNMVMAYNGLFTEPGLERAAWQAFFDAVRRWNDSWDEIALSSLSDEDLERIGRVRHGLRHRPDKTFTTWAVDIGSSSPAVEDTIDHLKRKSRQQLRQSLRAYGEVGELSLSVAETPEEAHDYFDRLGELHTARWNEVGLPGSFANPNWVRFHRGVIDDGFDAGVVQLLEVTCGADPIGYLYGHAFGDTVYMHQTGFVTTEDNRFRPGHICHLEAMCHYARNGLRYYDLLPDELDSYKKFFAEPESSVHWIELQRPRTRFRLERLLRHLRHRLRPDPDGETAGDA